MKNRIIIIVVSSLMLSLVTPNLKGKEDFIRYRTHILMEKRIIKTEDIQGENNSAKIMNFEVDSIIKRMNADIHEIESIENKKEWFIAYKENINRYSNVLDTPETIYDYYTSKELDILFRVVQAEVGDEYSFEQKINVASVIFNRIMHDDFANEMQNILTSDQFQSISDGRYMEIKVSEETILACEYSFMFRDKTNGCLFFDSNGKLNYEFVYSDGAHNFYR